MGTDLCPTWFPIHEFYRVYPLSVIQTNVIIIRCVDWLSIKSRPSLSIIIWHFWWGCEAGEGFVNKFVNKQSMAGKKQTNGQMAVCNQSVYSSAARWYSLMVANQILLWSIDVHLADKFRCHELKWSFTWSIWKSLQIVTKQSWNYFVRIYAPESVKNCHVTHAYFSIWCAQFSFILICGRD